MSRTVHGFVIQDRADLIERAQNDLATQYPDEDPRIRGSVWWVVARWLAGIYSLMQEFLARAVRELFPSTASEAFLSRHWASARVTRNEATACVVTVEFTYSAGGEGDIPVGTLLVADDGAEYLTTTLCVDPAVPGGTATCQAQAVVAGSASTVDVGGTLTLGTPVSGISSGEVLSSTAGTDQEAFESYRTRVMESLVVVPHPQTQAYWEQVARDFDGVTDAWADSPAPGWVRIIYTGAPVGFTAAMQSVADLTATVATVAAGTYAVDLTITGGLESGYDKTTVRTNIEMAVTSLFTRDGAPMLAIRNSALRAAIADAPGLAWYTLDDINGDGDGLSDLLYTDPIFSAAYNDLPLWGTPTWLGDLL